MSIAELEPTETIAPPTKILNEAERSASRTRTLARGWIATGGTFVAIAGLYLGIAKWDINQTVNLQYENPYTTEEGNAARQTKERTLTEINRMRDYDESRYLALDREYAEASAVWNVYETINMKRKVAIAKKDGERLGLFDLNFNDMKRSLLIGAMGALALWRGFSLRNSRRDNL